MADRVADDEDTDTTPTDKERSFREDFEDAVCTIEADRVTVEMAFWDLVGNRLEGETISGWGQITSWRIAQAWGALHRLNALLEGWWAAERLKTEYK